MFSSTGKLRYSAKRQSSDQNWWIVLDCDPEIGRYYRHLYHIGHSRCRKLARPFWGTHITVSRNEQPTNMSVWRAYAGKQVTFQYTGGIENNYGPERYRSFFWVKVVCPELLEIREELGLTRNPKIDLHLTIGSWENPLRKNWYQNTIGRRRA